jgi:type IV pilus assembly protein PilB
MVATRISGTQRVASGLQVQLVRGKRLSARQAEELQQKADQHKTPFIDVLLQSGIIDDAQLATFCATTFGYPLLDLTVFNPACIPQQATNARIMQHQYAIALMTRHNRLSVAISDPSNTQMLDQIKFQAQMTVDPIIVRHDSLLQLRERLLNTSAASVDDMAQQRPHQSVRVQAVKEDSTINNAEDADDISVVTFLQQMLAQAINMGASDLHFEPFETTYRIRFRIDGVLREIVQPPITIKDQLSSRIKVLANLDIAEKRVPQDGRMKLPINQNRSVDFRVSTLPTLFGEKIVIRILDGNQRHISIDSLGYEPQEKVLITAAIERPYGMILVTGPTGSGKTVSLYAYLNQLNRPGTNISTAEDPAEINMSGLNQVNINERAGLTFPVVLRAFLRQDPDIIMVGEIRDLETADIAIKAAQTGHLVFSTLHTNDAPSTLTRLINMGVAPFNIASSVMMITAQRLARRLCHCKQAVSVPVQALLDAGFTQHDLTETWTLFAAHGCEQCNQTGYQGRIGIHQIMMISPNIERLILTHASTSDIEVQARKEGMQTLREAGLFKVKQGLTSLEEIISLTNL